MKRSTLALIGGLIALLGIGLSLFIEIFGWWNFYTIFNNEVTDSTFYTAFFETSENYFNDELTYLLPGIIAGVGALLCITSNKTLSIIGGILIFVGIGVFLVLLGDSDIADLANYTDTNVFWDRFGVQIGDSFTGWRWQLGYGMIATAVGGVLGLVGGFTAKKR